MKIYAVNILFQKVFLLKREDNGLVNAFLAHIPESARWFIEQGGSSVVHGLSKTIGMSLPNNSATYKRTKIDTSFTSTKGTLCSVETHLSQVRLLSFLNCQSNHHETVLTLLGPKGSWQC